MAEVAKELFDELRGKNAKLPVAAFKSWSDVKELIEGGLLSKDELDEMLEGKKQLDFDQFYELVKELDEMNEDADSDDEDDEENVTDSEDDSQESDELDEEDLKEVAKELFDELRGKDKKVSVAAIMAWEDVKEMIEDEVVTKEQIKDIISGVAGDKKALDFDEFYEVVSQLDDAAESADDMDGAEILESSLGFGGSSSDNVEEDDFEVMNDEEVDEMLLDVYDELRGKSKSLTMKAFKKWEDISEMVDSKIIDEGIIDKLALKVGADSSKNLSFPQFKALVEMLDELAGEGDDSEEMDQNDSDNDDRLEIDAEALNSDSADDDDEEMTPEEVEEMTRDLFDTLRGKSKNLSVATFLSWDNIQDQTVLDDDTIDILLQEVGANSNRKGDLTYQQFSDLINLLDETVTALGDGEGQNMDIVDDEDLDDSADSVSATLEEREEIDNEIETERNERNVLDGIDDEGVDEIANEIYQDLKGKVND